MFFKRSATRVQDSQRGFPCPTQSFCTDCNQALEAILYIDHDQVWMNRYCPAHGQYTELISSDVEYFIKRRQTPLIKALKTIITGEPWYSRQIGHFRDANKNIN